MGLIQKAIGAMHGWQGRSSLENPQVPLSFPAEWLLDIFNGGRTDSGIRVSEMTALQVGTVFSCVNIVSNGVASLPYHVYEHVNKAHRMGKRVAQNHSLWDILHNEPNPEMTSFTFLKTLMVHGLLWGNSYAEIQRDNANQIVALWPRNPARTRPIRTTRALTMEGTTYPAGTLMYETTENMFSSEYPSQAENDGGNWGKRRIILGEDLLHVPGLSLDGRLGQSTVYLSRQIVGLALATEKYAAKFFGNGARPAGVLQLPSKMEDKAIENLRRSWAEAHGGENQFKVAVLEQGVKFEKIAATPEEGQMLTTRDYQRAEICAMFNVPLHMVAGANKGQGKSNVEQSSIEFVMFCLSPWLKSYEQEFKRKLFPKLGRTANKYFPKFDTRKLLYPDAASRATFYASGRQWGYLCANDVLEMEDMNPIEDGTGETVMVQVNMQNAKALLDGGAADGAKPPVPVAPTPITPKPGTPGKGKGKKGKRSTDDPTLDFGQEDEVEVEAETAATETTAS